MTELEQARADLAAARARVGELETELDVNRMAYRHGAPFDPTGVKNAIEIQGLRTALEQVEQQARELKELVLVKSHRCLELSQRAEQAEQQARTLHMMWVTAHRLLGLPEDAGVNAEMLVNRLRQAEALREALEQSVMFQSHYAVLLNGWDEGQRMTFENAQAWLDRLAQLAPTEDRSAS